MNTFDFSYDLDATTKGQLFAPPSLPDLSTPGPIETAFNTVKFGDVGDTTAFLAAVFAGHPNLEGLGKMTGSDFIWRGSVFDQKTKSDKPGKFFIVAPYDKAHMPKDDNALVYGTGLGDKNVGTPCVVCLEMDENPDGSKVPLAEQARRLDAMVALGVPPPNAVCLSGGKSLHGFFAMTGLTWAQRDKIQTALLAVTGADPSVGNRGRKMRLGGFRDAQRTQTILFLNHTPTTPKAMSAGLEAVRKAWGMTDAPDTVLAARNAARAERNGATGKTTGKTTATGKIIQSWNPSTESVVLADGSKKFPVDLPEGKHPCFCLKHKDNTPSAVVFVDGRRISLFCSTCNITLMPDAPRVIQNTAQPPVAGETRFNLAYWPKITSLTDGVDLVRSARGTGKTTAVVAGIRAELKDHPERRAIVILHRRALVAKYLHDLSGLGFVAMPDHGPIDGDRIVVCLDSLPRVPLFNATATGADFDTMPRKPWHVAYVDEIEQVIGHLDADSLAKNTTPERVVWALQTILGATAKVVMSDADLGSLTFDFVKLLGLPEPRLYINEYQPDRKARLYSYQEGVEGRLWSDWAAGKRVAVACTTKADASRIAKRLAEMRTTARVVCVTSETTADYQDLIANPDVWTQTNLPDALVYSPSLGTGVDVSIRNYWDAVFVVADVGLWTDMFSVLQAAERIRNPREAERHVWVKDAKLYGVSDLTTLRRGYVAKTDKEIRTALGWGLLPSGVWRQTICDTTREVLIAARAHRARAQGHILADATHAWVDAGWSLCWEADDSDDVARKQIRAERKAVKDAWLAEVSNATDMDLETAHAVLRSAAPRAERARALKTVLQDKLGVVLDDGLVKDWLYGDLARKIRIFGLWTLQGMNTAKFAEAITWNVARLADSSNVPTTMSAVERFSMVMHAYGVTPKMDYVSNKILHFGCHTTNLDGRDHQDDGERLAMGGVKRIRTRNRIPGGNGAVTATHAIDQASVERMARLTARWLERRGVKFNTDTLDVTVAKLLDTTLDEN